MPTTHQSISMPPSRANRKRVPSWAVILSAVEPTELRNCALVSRMFRYAVYLSAGVRLERYFRGGRLDRDTKHTSMNMANMWPYLLAREREANEKAGVYARSWLARVFDDCQLIAWKLWACPDNAKQATMAVRFLMTRLYFDVSVEAKTSWRDDTIIVDAQEVLHGEVWKITTREAGRDVQYHVLEATCEVIGLADPSLPSPVTALHDAESPVSCIPVRADWSAYVALRQTSPTVAGDSLLQHVSWEHRGSMTEGSGGDVGRVKLAVARRYIYACIVANSVSGQYMRLTEMVQEFHGVETKGIATTEKFRQKQTVKLNLFLPGHHHVESLHFTTSKGTPLHPDVAVVQTPGREYYILRDNGMQIGCEEDVGSASEFTHLTRVYQNQAVHSQNGFVLRRADESVHGVGEPSLAHDNKQLSGLIKEYESTLDTLMTRRTGPRTSLVRSYEEKLLQLEEENAKQDLKCSSDISEALARLGRYLRGLSRLEAGEPIEGDEEAPEGTDGIASDAPDQAPEDEDGQEPTSPMFEEVMVAPASYDQPLQREIELSRLEQENAELRRMLGLLPSYPLRRPQPPPSQEELAHRPQTAFEAGRGFERQQGDMGRPPTTFDPVGQGRGMPPQRGGPQNRGNTSWGLLRWE
ncbi:hypothetical protein BD626DRAFT_536682 [Schizophyllum amplum]|uniref:Uncharacterized protein n=1 Tax=Schizophyllum amplum TaxID=97359 RepID=A0A550CGQ6_9AGAR|nr:hypothetical protein BD626DRAFT_536682 [Auriculariopsis ampla]